MASASRSILFVSLLLACLALPGCLGSCSGDGSGQPDAGADVDTDTSWDGGPLTPCDGEPEEGEVCVPGGTYLLGCMPYDQECWSCEEPMVEVTLSPFFIDQRETTNEELLAFLNSLPEEYIVEGSVVKAPDDEVVWMGWLNGPPIGTDTDGDFYWGADGEYCTSRDIHAAAGGFSWLGAKLFCEWRGRRLPTEAEWEAAARGQTKWMYPCSWWSEPCWHGAYDCCIPGSSECFHDACEDCCIPFEEGMNGNCYSPNDVHAMYGNAAEWVLDGRDDGHSWCAGGCTDPAPRPGDLHYLKGGGVGSDAMTTRISARYMLDQDWGNAFTGVRCVRSPVSFD